MDTGVLVGINTGQGTPERGNSPPSLMDLCFSSWAAKCPDGFMFFSWRDPSHRGVHGGDPRSIREQILHGPDAATSILSKWSLSHPHPTGMGTAGMREPAGGRRSRGLSVANFNGDLFGANQGISLLSSVKRQKTSLSASFPKLINCLYLSSRATFRQSSF